MADMKIENVVASTTIADELDLSQLSKKLPEGEYEPEQFPGLVLRLDEPKTAALLFRSGKVVCTGAKTIDDVKKAISKVCKKVEKAGAKVYDSPDITVQNIVASANLHAQLNLNAIALAIGLEKVEYEPEQFPGLVYRLEDPHVVVLLFGSGKLVCTGARKAEQVSEAIDKIYQELDMKGLL
ncbi:MAG TPA: TATA-box-binding protein [Thermoplasmatales archaeon]|nr:TATA-box-binding protein [Thermoplasmatales archaeon]